MLSVENCPGGECPGWKSEAVALINEEVNSTWLILSDSPHSSDGKILSSSYGLLNCFENLKR